MRSLGIGAVTLLGVAVGGNAGAQRQAAPPLVGAEPWAQVTPASGFVDDPLAFDGAGGRLLQVGVDGDQHATLAVLDLGQKGAVLDSVPLGKLTDEPATVESVLDGAHWLVTARTDDERVRAGLLDATGALVRSWGPAKDIALATYDGKPVVVTYDVVRKAAKRGDRVLHTVAAFALETGKPVGKKRVLDADEGGYVAKLDMRILYFLDGYTKLVVVKGGTWDRKEDQRSPDREAWYDVPAGTFGKQTPIKDVTAHTRLARLRADHWNEDRFLMVPPDLLGLQLVADGEPTAVDLAEPFAHYLAQSLVYQRAPDGGFWFSLTVDPVNGDAVARQKADPQYLDLYRLDPGSAKATRLARKLIGKDRVVWKASRDYWAVLVKHVGFDRGGKALEVLRFTAR